MSCIKSLHLNHTITMASEDKYGIVIDSGSSGSRIQIYKWEDPSQAKASASNEVLFSPPKITQQEGWSKKISPGISSYSDKTSQIWKGHYKELIEFAQTIVPYQKRLETPVYILATAGMRLLSQQKQDKIVKETCRVLQKTEFYVPDCSHVQVIDGETEGVYGWLALNYLMGQFNNYDESAEEHESIGFMDMGGASTQIAFVPGPEEIKKHDEDLSNVVLRNVNGQTQVWRVFVETWLGFGANQARRRYLENLISLSLSSNPRMRTKSVNDPCLPKGATVESHTHNGRTFKIHGTGNYDVCLKEMYPLLMKNLPCKDLPCLFNGVHGPKMNFEKDKFVGVSEYWYTANDIFNSGGEYNFHSFNEKVREYCESDYSTILENSKNGQYSGLSTHFLLDACFKASWVINVLHEGFELPRLGQEIKDALETDEMKEVQSVHVPFKSADSVNGDDLSWTLGKILLVASSQIETDGKVAVGIMPSEISQAKDYDSDDDEEEFFLSLYSFILLCLFGFVVFRYSRQITKCVSQAKIPRVPRAVKRIISFLRNKSPPFLRPHISRMVSYMELQEQEEANLDLEAGNSSTPQASPRVVADQSVLRTRSTLNLGDEASLRPVEFMTKPFIYPKKVYRTESKDSLHRVSSTSSMSRGKKE